MDTLIHLASGLRPAQARLEELLDADIAGGDEGRIQLAIAAYRAGIGTSVNLSPAAASTRYGNHDAEPQQRGCRTSSSSINTDLVARRRRPASPQDVVMCITSDFGRTPNYNNGNGKDHWPISSMIVVTEKAQGGRVVGTTDEGPTVPSCAQSEQPQRGCRERGSDYTDARAPGHSRPGGHARARTWTPCSRWSPRRKSRTCSSRRSRALRPQDVRARAPSVSRASSFPG